MTTQSKDEQLRRDLEIEARPFVVEAFEHGAAQGRKEMALRVLELLAGALEKAPGTLGAAVALAEISMRIAALCSRELGLNAPSPDAPASEGGPNG